MSWQALVLELLSASLLRPFVLVAAAAMVIRLFRVEHPASKHTVWTAVLAGMLILPFVSVMAPHFEFEALPQGTLSRLGSDARDVQPLVMNANHAGDPAALSATASEEVHVSATALPVASRPIRESTGAAFARLASGTILLWVYLFGLIAFGIYRAIGWLMLRRLVSRSCPCASAVLRESTDVVIPIAVGFMNPSVILPHEWRQWTVAARRAVLAHEFAHIRRRDAWVSFLSRLVKSVLWFHPLSWYVSRKTSELSEMACDAAAVERIGDAGAYSRILVEFAGIVSRRGYRASLPGLAMFGRSPLGRRIDQVFDVSNGKRRRLTRPAAVLALIGAPALGAAATLGLTEAAARPLQQVQETLSTKLESVAQVAGTEGIVAAIAEVVPPRIAPAAEPLAQQSATSVKAFIDEYCVRCHGASTRYANLLLAGLDYGDLRKNAVVWEKIIAKFRSGMEPNTRGLPTPTIAEFSSVVEWVEGELDRGAPLHMPAPGPHRLNRTEYGNAIRDVLALDVDPSLLLPSDDSSFGFDNIARTLQPISSSVYDSAAERVIELASGNLASRQLLFPCPAETADDVGPCTQRLIDTIAARAFRRPLTDAEAKELVEVYKTKPAPFCCFFVDRGTVAVLRSILTDPRFRFRTEVEPPNVGAGQTYRISDLELATRLSYFLWSRGPDEQLIDFATRGQLSNPAVLEREARRMLKDPRASALTTNFASQWLFLRRLRLSGPMPSYPDFDEGLQRAMRTETEMFFSSIVQEDRNAVDLLTANHTFLNERLARHYGIPNVQGSEFRRVTLTPQFDVRRGLLGKAALLTVTSRPDRTSLVQRAKWVQWTFLGVHPPDPPPNVPPLGPITAPMRVVMEQANSIRVDCVSCHRLIDPIGIALDNFDQAGKWRTMDKGQLIDTSTELVDGTKINGPVDLRNYLVSHSDQFLRSLTQRLLTYGLGRGVEYGDMPLVRSIVRDAARDNNRFSAIIVGIVKSPVFQMNMKGEFEGL